MSSLLYINSGTVRASEGYYDDEYWRRKEDLREAREMADAEREDDKQDQFEEEE